MASFVGIRPEDISITTKGSYEVYIETVELLGAETVISFKSEHLKGMLLTQSSENFEEGNNDFANNFLMKYFRSLASLVEFFLIL